MGTESAWLLEAGMVLSIMKFTDHREWPGSHLTQRSLPEGVSCLHDRLILLPCVLPQESPEFVQSLHFFVLDTNL